MQNKHIPELTYLLSEVELKYGRRVATSTDFESLSVVIEHQTGELVSSSTLKRLWGYVSLNPTPRMSTLDILSRFVGHKDFRHFCRSLTESNIFSSTFFSSRCLVSSDLSVGQKVVIGWAPDRIIKVIYHGEHLFEVEESVNSQLKKGDRFELSEIILGYPLFISRILRDGEYTPSYIAGQNGGINMMDIEDI